MTQSITQCGDSNAEAIRCLRERYRLAIHFKPHGRASIARLFVPCSPAQIATFVALFVVNAIQRVCWTWFSANSAQKFDAEQRAVVEPVIGQINTTSAVMFIFACALIRATIFNLEPQFRFRRVRQAMRRVAKLRERAGLFGLQASAAFCITCAKILSQRNDHRSTRATTLPHRAAVWCA